MRLAIIICLCLPTIVHAQSRGALTLINGTVLRGVCKGSTEIETEFGKQEIPFSKITDVIFGYHFTDTEKADLVKNVKLLGNNDYKLREKASVWLRTFGPRCHPFLVKGMDAEVNKRIELIQELIGPPEQIDKDVVSASRNKLIGTIRTEKITFVDECLGELKIDISRVKRFKAIGVYNFTVTDTGTWVDTGLYFDGENFEVSANGMIDFWKAARGTNISGPKGMDNQRGLGGFYNVGALIACFDTGPSFMVGEKGVFTGRGKLMLKVVSSTWNELGDGSYSVNVETK